MPALRHAHACQRSWPCMLLWPFETRGQSPERTTSGLGCPSAQFAAHPHRECDRYRETLSRLGSRRDIRVATRAMRTASRRRRNSFEKQLSGSLRVHIHYARLVLLRVHVALQRPAYGLTASFLSDDASGNSGCSSDAVATSVKAWETIVPMLGLSPDLPLNFHRGRAKVSVDRVCHDARNSR